MQEGEDLRFTFEKAAGSDVPYWMQGTESYDTPEALAMRAAVKEDVRVQRELDRFWSAYNKDDADRISKAEYLKVHVKIGLVLVPDLTPEEAHASGEEDWKEDARGQETMGRAELFACLFQLADMWVDSLSAEDYAKFLRRLFRRVTVRYTTHATGSVSTVAPAPPPKEHRKAWESFRDSRREKLGLAPLAVP